MAQKCRARAAVAFVVGAFLSSSCSLLINADATQCEREADCDRRGFSNHECVDYLCVKKEEELDPKFACRDDPWEDPGSEEVEYPFRITRLLGDKPYGGLTFFLCPSFDPDCEEAIEKAKSNKKGRFSLSVPVGFRGHIYAPAPEDEPTMMPLKAYLFPPPSKDPKVPPRPQMVVTTQSVVLSLASLGKATPDLKSGHVIFTAIDCMGKPLEGVSVSTSADSDDSWRVYVGAGGQPDPSLEATGPSGRGALLNVPPGYLNVRGVHKTEGKIFEQSIIVSPGALTSVPIIPSPLP